ncbi:MAG: deoxyhypusine synthase family protein [Candidatus Sungbacteria bacterium]|nr:deoxyhypusine synthase family protein [Candidatus Sungbacteria bacterium]
MKGYDMHTLEELKPIDLKTCPTIGEVVEQMRSCSFGARMLGETADTLRRWITMREPPVIIWEGARDTALGILLEQMKEKKWCSRIMTAEEYRLWRVDHPNAARGIMVLGAYPERYEYVLNQDAEHSIFINPHHIAPPGRVVDGYFPNVVFADPRFIMPLLWAFLRERLDKRSSTVWEFFAHLQRERYGGLAADVLEGARVLEEMIRDPECTVFMTVSGAMTVAQMSIALCDVIDRGWVQCLSTTGALMAHGLIAGVGLKHYKYNPHQSDALLARRRINRVTDTLEPETNFDHIEEILDRIFDKISGVEPISPRILHEMIGKQLVQDYPDTWAILKSAYQKGVPVLVPAFVDSEIGNDLYIHNQKRKRDGRPRIVMDLELDSEFLVDQASAAKRMGIFTIGGGVPRNNTQNVAPLIEIMNERLGENRPYAKFSSGVRICPDPPDIGHLSGCTYSENKSWRKIEPGAVSAELLTDATIVLPFLVRYLMEAGL